MEPNQAGQLRFTAEGKYYTLSYKRIYLSDSIERINVFGKEKSILFQSDRPEIRLKEKRRAPKWKIIEGGNPEMMKHSVFIHSLIYQLESELDHIEFPKGINAEYQRTKKSY